MLVDVTSGREQLLRTPARVSGTVAWSPDGTRIACPLLLSQESPEVHEVDVSTGKVRRTQGLPQRFRGTSTWMDVAWNPKSNEILFAEQRRDAPQIWSMPSGGPPIMVQMPLTKYRPEDIVILQKLAALPDGSGAIYSADVVNGAGNFELYRIGAKGGKPVCITNTARDEFAPAVSPDGRLVAHVSNQLGNIDLFTMPVSGGEKKHIGITGLKFRSPGGRLRVRTL